MGDLLALPRIRSAGAASNRHVAAPWPLSVASIFSALSDGALLDALARGRVEALVELYGRYSQAMWRLARIAVEPRLAPDIVMHVVVDLWRSPFALRGETPDQTGWPVGCRLLDAVTRRCIEVHDGSVAHRRVPVLFSLAGGSSA